MERDQFYMQRCIQLAKMAVGYTQPNPMVGAVLVYDDRIIGEGYHQQFGGPHAEVNCMNSVSDANRQLISKSTLYVSLEPCAHFGKTPPCSLLILQHKIPRVVIGTLDPFEAVNGKGIDQLKAAGVEVVTGLLEKECKELNKRFFTFHTKKRPYMILKWAQTADAFIANHSTERLFITNAYTNRLVHKWRSEEAAIFIGKNTALQDNPLLNNRYWPNGAQPLRMVIDADCELPERLHILSDGNPTLVWNRKINRTTGSVEYIQWKHSISAIPAIVQSCYEKNIQSILVEGGTTLLQCFIDAGLWDDARVITNTTMWMNRGLPAPKLHGAQLQCSENLQNDFIQYFIPAEYE